MPEYEFVCLHTKKRRLIVRLAMRLFGIKDKPCGVKDSIFMASQSSGEILKRWPPHCPRCGRYMTRKPSRTAVVFKGEGWTGKISGGEHA